MTGDRASVSQRPVVRQRHCERVKSRICSTEVPSESEFFIATNGSVALLLLGELDITSMVQFERTITEVLSGNPKQLIFDLTHSQFILLRVTPLSVAAVRRYRSRFGPARTSHRRSWPFTGTNEWRSPWSENLAWIRRGDGSRDRVLAQVGPCSRWKHPPS